MNKLLSIFLILFLLTACASAAGPEKTVEKFIQAINAKDSNAVSTLACKEWETDALLLLDSFQAVTTTLKGLSCQQTGTDPEGYAIVTCQGQLIASYNGELQEFDLSAQQYILQNFNGEWRICGTN